ncbi:MAG TPA: YfhO family protein [Candidatus Microbacterium stercoravium]|uniref:YfhO family protein n=1 Tax=Candidatus Microbacterium stercoravium TaxID=2838697 RepID=A0A9D2H7V2_9MICO|nr:YfhO family protein [Candidatus Microbacterium stercoravium]
MTQTRETFWRRVRWPLASVVVTVLLAASRVLLNPRFYFADDTERGSFGQWWSLGEHLSRGTLPILDPSAWQGGNYFAEGQWGILSPVTWLIGLTAYVAPDAAAHVTAWKILFLAVFAIGMYLICREFGASRPWAALAATLAPAAGFTVYMDAASWSTGLFDSCLLPLVWWTLRRAVEHGRSPIPYVITSFTLVTFGYVFGVIVLVVLLAETLVRHIVQRDRVRILRTLAASVWGGLWTIVVYLPAMMTSSVTTRSEAPYENTGFLNADLSDLFSAASPLTTATIQSFDGPVTPGPLVYVAWILPLLPLFLPIPRESVRRLVPVWIYGAIALAFIVAPSDLGAIRWPLRMMPYVVIAALIIFAVAATKAFPERLTRSRAWASVALIAAMAYISWVGEMGSWKAIAVGSALQVAAVVAVVLVARRKDGPFVPGRPSSWEKKTAFVVVCSMLVTLGVGGAQLLQWRESPLPSVNAPTDTAELRDVLSDTRGDAIVVGNYMKGAGTPESWDERLMANLWYISEANVSSVYTVLPFSAYAHDLCSDLRGLTCKDALETLWSDDEETGEPVADLLSVSTILAAKHTFPDEPEAPKGWHLANDGGWMWQFERDDPLPAAGGVVWTGEGTAVTETDETQTSLTFTVEQVGEDPRVAISRLPFPGYSVDGAELADPVRDYLLTVDVTGLDEGDEVTVQFLPPPFPVLAGSFVLAWLLLAGWLIARFALRRRARA